MLASSDKKVTSRRQLLVGGAATGAAWVILSGRAGGDGTDDGHFAIGTVVEGGSADKLVQLRVDNQVIQVEPRDFKEGWELLRGDRLLIDLDNALVWPYLRPVDAEGRKRVFSTVNEDPELERTIGG